MRSNGPLANKEVAIGGHVVAIGGHVVAIGGHVLAMGGHGWPGPPEWPKVAVWSAA